MNPQSRQEGQVVLITLLVLTIATTVALSLISRTTTDTTITNQIEESSRAFSAAEAGIEEALKSGSGTSGAQVLTPGVSYEVSVADVGGAPGLYVFPRKTLRGVTETLWLVNHDANGVPIETPTYTAPSIDVCWSSEATFPALVATIVYKESSDGSYRTAKVAYDPDPDATRAATNNFISTYTPGGCGDPATDYKETITFSALNPTINPSSDTLLMVRIRPLYSDTKIVVDAGAMLPLQGNRIESTGSTATGTNRKIVVFQQYRSPSTIFDAALYSQDTIVH